MIISKPLVAKNVSDIWKLAKCLCTHSKTKVDRIKTLTWILWNSPPWSTSNSYTLPRLQYRRQLLDSLLQKNAHHHHRALLLTAELDLSNKAGNFTSKWTSNCFFASYFSLSTNPQPASYILNDYEQIKEARTDMFDGLVWFSYIAEPWMTHA